MCDLHPIRGGGDGFCSDVQMSVSVEAAEPSPLVEYWCDVDCHDSATILVNHRVVLISIVIMWR